MNPYLFLHLFFIGVWGGLVLVEMILEVTLKSDSSQRHQMAQLHYRIDMFAEIPILIMVLLSGLLLLNISMLSSPLYLAKVLAGLSPVIINGLCIIPVVKRKFASDRGEEEKMKTHTKYIFIAFFTGFAMAFVALGLGLHSLGIL